MKVFLSWSGQRSNLVAHALRHWLPAVLQATRPYYSPDDIDKGMRWSAEVANELQQGRSASCALPERTFKLLG